jgi:ABC-type lipoprotein export system ATPase subunit
VNQPLTAIPIDELMLAHPYAGDYLESLGIKPARQESRSLEQWITGQPVEFFEDYGMSREEILSHFAVFMARMREAGGDLKGRVNAVTILGGHDKNRQKETVSLTLEPGEIICIVGPTGSGKSRLLADIECLAQRDTPTGRQILVNHQVPDFDKRFALEHKLVAQLSQNMNFVVDLAAGEFVAMHAESRMVKEPQSMAREVLDCANELAGEKFTADVPVTQLSGGQSRALMIADTALLSGSPVILIDEIENAGVDRKKALELLIKKEKIVLMSTHDPILALMGTKRVVIRNGGIWKVIETSAQERDNLRILEKIDRKLMEVRNLLRSGSRVDFDIGQFLDL